MVLDNNLLTFSKDCISNSCGLIFDFDGVIADTEYYHYLAYAKLLSSYGVSLSSDGFIKYMGNSEAEIYARLEADYELVLDFDSAIKKRLGYFFKLIEEHHLEPFHQTLTLLRYALQEGKPAFIVSSQKTEVINKLLDMWSLRTSFSGICTVYDAGMKKKDILLKLDEILSIDPSCAVLVEDSSEIIRFGHNLGMKTIAVIHRLNANIEITADVEIQV